MHPSASSLTLARLADFNLGLLIDQVVGHEGYPHAPARICSEQPAELAKRQFLIVDMDGDFAVGPAVLDEAAEQVATQHSLVT